MCSLDPYLKQTNEWLALFSTDTSASWDARKRGSFWRKDSF